MPVRASVLLVSETHLTSLISDATVHIPGYQLLRNNYTSAGKHGVCAYVLEDLKVDSIDVSHPNVLSFQLSYFNVWVCVVYRPPSYSLAQNEALIRFISDSFSNKESIIMGDFNLPSLKWDDNQELFTKVSKRQEVWKRFMDLESRAKDPTRLMNSRGNTLLEEEREEIREQGTP